MQCQLYKDPNNVYVEKITSKRKVKSNPIKIFGEHDFLHVVFTSKTSMTNNKGYIGHYRYEEP